MSDYDFGKPRPADPLIALPGDPPALVRYLAQRRRARTMRESGERQGGEEPVPITGYVPGDLDHLDDGEPAP